MCLRWHFYPRRRGKNTGVKMGVCELYRHIFGENSREKTEKTRRTPQLKQLKKLQRKIFLDIYTFTIPLIINTLIINKSFLKK